MLSDMQVLQCFSDDYATARQAFLSAAQAAGAEIESLQNPCQARDEALLCCDIAVLGPRTAKNMLVVISGTHGVEGFCGSAIQVGLLRSGLSDRLRADVGVVMIHALNPYGFANLRRGNEVNIDLNRNFIDHAGALPKNEAYDQLADLIAPKSFSPAGNLFAMLKLKWYRLRFGHDKLQQAVTSGQYSHPQGLFYGGRSASWSNRILHEVSARFLAGAARVIAIDIHTGLGLYGVGEVILNDSTDSPSYRRAVRWWTSAQVKSTASGESVSAHLSGTINLAFARMLPAAEVTAAGLEFGTLPALAVFKALRAENWLHHYGRQGLSEATKVKQRFLRAFYPDDDIWKQRVWKQGRQVVEEALSALSEDAVRH